MSIPDVALTGAEEIRQVLTKYDGDFTAEEIEAGLAGEPIEKIVIVNDEIVEHTINGVEGGTINASN
jgi:hypothetical protein